MARAIRKRSSIGDGRIIEYGHSYFYVPDSIKRADLRSRQSEFSIDATDHDGEPISVVEHSSQKQAELWGQLQTQLGSDYERLPLDAPGEVDRHNPRDAEIPVAVAREAKPRLAAWMFCAGYSTGGIGRALDVSERTVEQYLSDVRRGER